MSRNTPPVKVLHDIPKNGCKGEYFIHGPIVQKVDNNIPRINHLEIYYTIQWVDIYLVNSIVPLYNNQDQKYQLVLWKDWRNLRNWWIKSAAMDWNPIPSMRSRNTFGKFVLPKLGYSVAVRAHKKIWPTKPLLIRRSNKYANKLPDVSVYVLQVILIVWMKWRLSPLADSQLWLLLKNKRAPIHSVFIQHFCLYASLLLKW